MRRLILLLLILLTVTFTVQAQVTFKPTSVGIHTGYTMPEDPIDNTLGFGIQSELGTLVFMQKVLTFGAIINYWAKTYGDGNVGEYTYSQAFVAAYIAYSFARIGMFVPYGGLGFGLAFNKSEFKYSQDYLGYGLGNYSDTQTRLGILLTGGMRTSLNERFQAFFEARYLMSDLAILGFYIGLNYMLSSAK